MKPSLKSKVDNTNFQEWLTTATSLSNTIFFAIDLRPYEKQLIALQQAKTSRECAIFLGCKIGQQLATLLMEHHAVIFPNITGRPYPIYRKSLYTVDELFSGYDPNVPESREQTLDWRIFLDENEIANYNQSLENPKFAKFNTEEYLARTLHDYFIQEQLDRYLEQFNSPMHRGIIAIMGGHGVLRSELTYHQMAMISRQLTRDGFLIASGGGEGLMEAANLGAWFAPLRDDEMNNAIAMLSINGADSTDNPLWLSTAWKVRNDTLHYHFSKRRNLSVSTWLFNAQNVFATDIAKFFEYSLREQVLISIAKQGMIYAEGSSGTLQEIFESAFQNQYNQDTYKYYTPMICFGEGYWDPNANKNSNFPNNGKPVWPLLLKLAQEAHFEHCLLKTSDPNAVIEFIRNFKYTSTLPT
ncbi:MAG TPA: hypothetical protein VJK54_03385 [Chthoniobacterales bacterium]|nr:hypothetical protein [Chthoniobacterales bacterium]